MSNLNTLLTKMKRDIELKYVYVMMKPDELQTIIDYVETLENEVEKYHKLHDEAYNEMRLMQRELDEKEDALSYAMNQIQIKETAIRKIEKDYDELWEQAQTWREESGNS